MRTEVPKKKGNQRFAPRKINYKFKRMHDYLQKFLDKLFTQKKFLDKFYT